MAKWLVVCWALLAALTGAAGGRRARAHAADLYTDDASGGPGSLAIVVIVGGVAATGYVLYRREAPARRRRSVPRVERSQERLVARRVAGDPTPPPTNRGRHSKGTRTRRHAHRRW